jgi:steroid delta-isomerase-like uncharacterized protein
MSENHKEAIRNWVEDVINKGNLSVVDKVIHPDYVYRSPAEELRGPQAIISFIATFRAAFPDLKLRIDDLLVDGGKTVIFFTLTGTHQGNFMGIAATGKHVTVNGTVLSRFEEGKIIEEFEILDQLAMYQQLGVISMPA